MQFISFILYLYVCGAALAVLFNFNLKSKGLTGIPWMQCLNPIKMFNVGYGYVLGLLVPQHVFEQYVLRLYSECREECLLGNRGKCTKCGCSTYQKMLAPGETDSKDRWGKIIWNKKKYKELREKYPVQIKITYGKEKV